MGVFIDNYERLKDVLSDHKKDGDKIVLNGGTYDLLGTGHIDFLQRAKKYGNTLVVNITTDERVRNYKRPGGPVNSEIERAKVISSLELVDYAIVYPYDHPGASIELAEFLNPNIDVIVRESEHWTYDIKKRVKDRLGDEVSLRSIKPKKGSEEYRTSKKILKIKLEDFDFKGLIPKGLEDYVVANL
jgi:cytidyltransferase-like protein